MAQSNEIKHGLRWDIFNIVIFSSFNSVAFLLSEERERKSEREREREREIPPSELPVLPLRGDKRSGAFFTPTPFVPLCVILTDEISWQKL